MNNITTTTISSIVIELNNARSAVQQFGQPVLFTIGIIGCILNIITFTRPAMRQNSCALYLHGSSWANFFCLTWGVLASMLAFFTKNNPASYNAVYCKIRFYMINFAQYSSRAFVILACLDRFLLCSASVRQRNFCRPTVARRVIILSTLICACLPIYILVTYRPGQRIIPCTTTTAAGTMYEIVASWVLTFGIPIFSMSIFSGLIIKRLKQNAKRVGRDKIRVAGRDVQLTSMLIAQILLYMMTNLPYASLALYGALTDYVPIANRSAERLAAENFTNTFLASFFYYCFNGLSFFVYTLTAPSFRRELLSAIFPKKWLRNLQEHNDQHTLTHVHPLDHTRTSVHFRRMTPVEGKIILRTNAVHPA